MNPWGYVDDILIVRDEGVRLGLIRKLDVQQKAV